MPPKKKPSRERVQALIQAAPCAPFLVIRLSWVAIDLANGSPFWGSHSRAWMAKAPPDWTGFWDVLAKAVPENGRLLKHMWDGADVKREGSGIGCVLLSGIQGPWVDTEQVDRGDWSSPRIPTLELTMEFDANLPREWEGAWHDEMGRRWVDEPGLAIESALAGQGFEQVWSLGFHADGSGPRHPTNMAAERWPRWVEAQAALALRQELGELATCSAEAGRRLRGL
jgi:hypothetical protein